MRRLIENRQMRGAEKATYALPHRFHQQNPRQDRKVENSPVSEISWLVFQVLCHS